MLIPRFSFVKYPYLYIIIAVANIQAVLNVIVFGILLGFLEKYAICIHTVQLFSFQETQYVGLLDPQH